MQAMSISSSTLSQGFCPCPWLPLARGWWPSIGQSRCGGGREELSAVQTLLLWLYKMTVIAMASSIPCPC